MQDARWDGMAWDGVSCTPSRHARQGSMQAHARRVQLGPSTATECPPRRLAASLCITGPARQRANSVCSRDTLSRDYVVPRHAWADQNRVPGPARGLTGYLCNRPEGVQPASGSSHPTGSLSDPLAPVLRDQVPAMDRVTQVDAAFPLVGNNTPDSSPLRRACWSAKRHWGPICFPLPRSRPSGACLGLCARQEFPYRPSSP